MNVSVAPINISEKKKESNDELGYEVFGDLRQFLKQSNVISNFSLIAKTSLSAGTDSLRAQYIAATSQKLAQKHLKKETVVYTEGKIIGATGLLLGLAKRRGWKGMCLLGATTGFGAERGVALSVFNVMTDILEPDTKKEIEEKT